MEGIVPLIPATRWWQAVGFHVTAPIEHKTGYDPEPAWTLWRKEKSRDSAAGKRCHDFRFISCSVPSLVNIIPELPRLSLLGVMELKIMNQR
jgi:hypothetical protein